MLLLLGSVADNNDGDNDDDHCGDTIADDDGDNHDGDNNDNDDRDNIGGDHNDNYDYNRDNVLIVVVCWCCSNASTMATTLVTIMVTTMTARRQR